MIPVLTPKTGRGLVPMIDYSLRRRVSLYTLCLALNTVRPQSFPMFSCLILLANTVWCWGWDGAGDLDGPDVDPIWESMSNKSIRADAVHVRHNRSIPGI
jgi:hypothetical protein